MNTPFRARAVPLTWWIASLMVALAFYTWAIVANIQQNDARQHDQARNTYAQCMESAQRSNDLHEVLVGILGLAVDSTADNPRAKAITAFLDQKLPPRDCSSLKP